jgi:hypothetical protein
MSALKLLAHLFLPHESNNQKAKLIHSSSLGIFVLFIVSFQLILNAIPKTLPSVLGYAANISPSEVIRLTNERRTANGLSSLSENKSLDAAALAKGQDMLSKGYWAHFGPDGTSPWTFFTNFGYKYQYAGENLARDFSSPQGAVEAWMNSPTHKENILNPKYKEIGIGVVEGSLGGADTTIIVQFFGTTLAGAPSIPVAKAQEVSVTKTASPSSQALAQVTVKSPVPEPSFSPTPTPTALATPVAVVVKPAISPFDSTKSISLGVLGVVLLVLSIDLLIVRKNKIVRIGGKNLAHIAYLSMVLAVILILKAGRII